MTDKLVQSLFDKAGYKEASEGDEKYLADFYDRAEKEGFSREFGFYAWKANNAPENAQRFFTLLKEERLCSRAGYVEIAKLGLDRLEAMINEIDDPNDYARVADAFAEVKKAVKEAGQ